MEVAADVLEIVRAVAFGDVIECIELMKAAGFESIDVERFKISWLWGLMTARGKNLHDARGEIAEGQL